MFSSFTRHRFLPVLVLTALLGASPGAAQGQTKLPALPTKVAAESAEKLRLAVFDQVWAAVNQRYYDAKFGGVDWAAMRLKYRPLAEKATVEAELYDVLDSMLEELHDDHTIVTPPREQREVESGQETTVGLDISLVEHQRIITMVAPASQAARAGVKVGMILKTVDGKPISEVLRQAHYYFSRVMGGQPGTAIRLGLVRADGTPWQVRLTRRLLPLPKPVFEARLLPSGVAYLKFDHFRAPADKQVKAALKRFQRAPGLVLDLRDNGGGNEYVEEEITGYFFNSEITIGRSITRPDSQAPFWEHFITFPNDLKAGRKGGQLYAGPVAILVAYDTASAAESFANTLQEQGRAQLFGQPSSGSLLGVQREMRLKDGGELDVSEIGYISAKGRVIEGQGLALDQRIPMTVADVQQGRDATLEAALSYLAGLAKPSASPPLFKGSNR